MKPFLIQHLLGESQARFPVWLMRQAGRYLPSYRKIREKHSFWEMASRPEVAAEVTLLPLAELPVDALILFSDILTMPFGLGLPIEMRESVGPVNLKPLATEADFGVFRDYDPKRHTAFVGEALDRIRAAAPKEIAVLGFAGAPWTVASYLVEDDRMLGEWIQRDPRSLITALEPLADATSRYLHDQVEHGADAVQLFDTWLSEMPRWFFREHYLPLLNRMFDSMPRVPHIFFCKQAHHLIPDFSSMRADILSVDSLLSLPEWEARTEAHFPLQGNFDPRLLFADIGTVRLATRKLVAEARSLSEPAILNLGHGILPGTPVENVRAFVEEARQAWV